MQKFKIQPRQIIIIISIIIAVFLLLDYQSRMNQLYRVRTQRDLIVDEVVQLKETEQALNDQLEMANSPEMVEQFAREDMNAAKPGDVVIVPISPYEVTQVPTLMAEPTPQVVTKWEVWKALFFDEE